VKRRKRVENRRLGVGEFEYGAGFNANRQERGYDRDGPRKSRLNLEALLLEVLFEIEPEVEDSLDRIADTLPGSVGVEGPDPAVPREKVREWMRRWNLEAEWCRKAAEQFVLVWWRRTQRGGQAYRFEALKRRAHHDEKAAQPFMDCRLKIDFGSWPLTQWTKPKFKERCRKKFEKELLAFCSEIEKKAVAIGMIRTREKRERDHFNWLARRLIKRESATAIQRTIPLPDRPTTRAINKAINTLASELDLRLPKSKRSSAS